MEKNDLVICSGGDILCPTVPHSPTFEVVGEILEASCMNPMLCLSSDTPDV